MAENGNERLRTSRRFAQYLTLSVFATALLYGCAGGWRSTFAICLIAAGPFALGAFIGFLFGMPRLKAVPARDGEPESKVESNTNLEQVSDWLTKILIGVGLTQLTQLPGEIQDMAEYIAPAVGPATCWASAVIIALLIYFAIAGFVWGYLVTKLVLEPELARRPDPVVVRRLANTRTRDLEPASINEQDAAEMLRFSPEKLKTPEELIAWGRAKLRADGDPSAAIAALTTAVERAPADPRAVASAAFASLYDKAPGGFTRTIELARGFLERSRGAQDPRDADLYGYLACAYGQQYRWAAAEQASAAELQEIRDRAVAAVSRALALDPQWKPRLRKLAAPEPGSSEDDLAALRNDEELKQILGL